MQDMRIRQELYITYLIIEVSKLRSQNFLSLDQEYTLRGSCATLHACRHLPAPAPLPVVQGLMVG